MSPFKLVSDFTPTGDQPDAIKALSENLIRGEQHQVLLGVTGSGKTFTMAHAIAKVGKPTLVLAPNKTLAAQLYNEFRSLFPENAVEYFVSYYDYYQPEAYIPSSDTYIQKDSSINEMIDKMRHSATRSVLTRQDVIVVASVSCIFGLGEPEEYLSMKVEVEEGLEIGRDTVLARLVAMQYERNDMDFHRGVFRVRGDRLEVFPAYEESLAVRIDFFGDQIESISEIDALKGTVHRRIPRAAIFPASHYVMQARKRRKALQTIQDELKKRVQGFREMKKFIEEQRIEERTLFDMEMIQEIGYCNGIENYSRHFTGRSVGDPPPTLLDYFPDDYLLFIDESHIAIPQLRAMYKGDRSRKMTLVEYGFRLPSALDNRPLKFEETVSRINQAVYVSATPAEYELEKGSHAIVEQIVRPTGLLDPEIVVRSAENQVDDLLKEIRKRSQKNERVLVTTLTKRMAEDLTDYYSDMEVKVRYLHADINTLERMDIIRDLRMGAFDVLVGINLLREGLDIPEVSLVAILDADKEGFLRSTRSLIQTCGRAARNVSGCVIMYADVITGSMQRAIEETDRRRTIQKTYNDTHGITPKSIQKEITGSLSAIADADYLALDKVSERLQGYDTQESLEKALKEMETEMKAAARELAFERAAILRDQIAELKKTMLFEL
ncbi:MAG: excinuclease ABC subunit UvrB [Deltaproteobacteria bacterium]|jgi:excinuclease ABC subunit B|nr:excinuclease ABC subunit UvrB [Deltaproteobacteria bacterium]